MEDSIKVNPAIRPRMMSIAPFGGEAEETPGPGAAPPAPPQPDGAHRFETAGSDSPLPPRRDKAAHRNEPDPGGRLRPDEEPSLPTTKLIAWDTHRRALPQRKAVVAARRKEARGAVRAFYAKQEQMLETFEEADRLIHNGFADGDGDGDAPVSIETEMSTAERWSMNTTICCNVMLLILKIVVLVRSGSIAVLSSTVDSALDLLSGAIIFVVSRYMKKRNRYLYPMGKGRFDAVATVVIASIMVTAAFELIRQAVVQIVTDSAGADMDVTSWVLMATTVVVKLALFGLCYTVKKTAMISALCTDQANDAVSNAVAMAGAGAARHWANADPVGCIIVGLFIIFNWYREGREHIFNLAGRGASPEMIQALTYVAMNHDRRVLLVDTVRAIHIGANFLVEVDIVLPPEMPLHEAHDIGESLQHKLEALTEVDRAHVHLDFEIDHGPEDEHKRL